MNRKKGEFTPISPPELLPWGITNTIYRNFNKVCWKQGPCNYVSQISLKSCGQGAMTWKPPTKWIPFGVVICTFTLLLTTSLKTAVINTNWKFVLVFFNFVSLCKGISALSFVMEEKAIKLRGSNQTQAGLVSFLFWTSLAQFLVLLPLFWVDIIPGVGQTRNLHEFIQKWVWEIIISWELPSNAQNFWK